MIDKLSKEKCVGCKSCGDICPKTAISYSIDEEGFWYPQIDYDKCISCQLCERACPILNKTTVKELDRINKPKALKVYSKDDYVRTTSTSGGAYYPLAEYILNQGGEIIGCVYDDDWMGAHHIVSNNFDGLKKIYGSKYFQSDTEGIYKTAKKVLDSGKQLLFCGAPCQVAGLYSYLNKKYDNLYTVDFICLGINSPKAYKSYMQELEKKYHSKIKKVHLKNKTHGWTNLGTRVEFENGKVYYRNRNNDPWVNGFVIGKLYTRPSCSNCEFKSFPRVADISIGDFWGLKFTKEEAFKGVSLIIPNSNKGEELIGKLDDKLFVEEKELQQAIDGNPAILNSVAKGTRREKFFGLLEEKGFSNAVWEALGLASPKWQLRYIKIKVKDTIKKLI